MDDTICSIATSLGVGAISIIRVSGKDAIKIVNQIFKGKNLEIILNCASLYCAAMLLKLSTYLSSFFPNLL